ncbi:MAG: radical SAM protein, partial [Clostridia bacterium]
NKNVSHGYIGNEISTAALCDEFLRLESIGVNNINLVTPSHFAPQIIKAASLAKKHGLHLPFLWNSSGYEKVETIKMLDGIIDIYLPDFKYKSGILSKKYSGAADYFEIACEALSEMKRQASENIFKKSIMQRGVIVRHLVLPGCTDDSLDVLDYLFDTYKNHIYYSIMSQYTPFGETLPDELSRKVTDVEYQRVTSYAELLGIKNGFFQQGEAASESFIPLFG